MRSVVVGVAAACLAVAAAVPIVPPVHLAAAPYAEWAHHHWVWLNNGVSNQVNVSQLVKDYQARNITVGAVEIDSGWSTGFNNFIVDTNKFPDLGSLVNDLHSQDIKVLLWATSMIDTDSSNFDTALNNSYMIKNALNKFSTLKWWHGKGGLLDYTNPEAVEWWHKQMDLLLDLGIDGWKTDGTDPYIIEYVVAHGKSGVVSYRDYADHYYGDFFNYTRSKNPEALIMSRPVDSYPLVGQAGAYLTFSPHYVMFSGWVGDEDPDWTGMQQALTNMIYSAWYNYTNFGCDIGGYRSGPGVLGRTKEVFTRWYQLGSMLPLMENGGDKEHRPWKFDTPGTTDTTDNYRKFVNIHYQLVPYLLTTGTQSYEAGVSSIRPQQPRPKHLSVLQLPDIKDHSFMLGANYFVTPVLAANVTHVTVTFPNSTDHWVDYFQPASVYAPGSTTLFATPLDRFPIFVRTSSITPLRVSTNDLFLGTDASADALTFLVEHPRLHGGAGEVFQELREAGDGHGGLVVSYSSSDDSTATPSLTLRVSAHSSTDNVIFLVRGVCPIAGAATFVTASAAELSSPDTPLREAVSHPATVTPFTWSFAAAAASPSGAHEMFIRLGSARDGLSVTLSNVEEC